MDGEQRGSRNREGKDEKIIIYKQLAKVLQDKICSLFFQQTFLSLFEWEKISHLKREETKIILLPCLLIQLRPTTYDVYYASHRSWKGCWTDTKKKENLHFLLRINLMDNALFSWGPARLIASTFARQKLSQSVSHGRKYRLKPDRIRDLISPLVFP